MIFVNTIVATAIFLASTATSAPSNLVTKEEKTIKLCTEPNFVSCTDVAYTPNDCIELSTDLNDAVNSVDLLGNQCSLYVAAGCAQSEAYFSPQSPVEDLATGDDISSFRCK
ncbi:hypothetical protein LZ554_004482 [Drepanopeziza brunnea f. sp. 'monogermtubi']|nr:hypothetical protein LZ554_004482 [Drepanopeziza brunnea f. sp. 'monogermtubi']